jgi:hypothetical protein
MYFFGLGLQKDAPELLEELIDMPLENMGHRWMKMFGLGDFLMAAYTTPYRVIEKGVYRASLEAADLFQQTAEGEIVTPFSSLSRMHLLYFVQLIMRDNYGYDFLANAIYESAGKLIDGDIEEQRRAYAIFLLSVAYIDTGKGASFNWLLEEFKGHLPLDLRLAISHEGENSKARDKSMKRLRKNLEASFKSSQKFHSQARDLYELQVGSLSSRENRVDEDEDGS